MECIASSESAANNEKGDEDQVTGLWLRKGKKDNVWINVKEKYKDHPGS